MTDALEPGWDDIAQWYDECLSAGSGVHETALRCTLRLCGPLGGLDVLDMACGQGIATRALASECRTITGVDSSVKQIQHALAYEEASPLGIKYSIDDARHLESIPSESFDLVTCQLALMDIPDLTQTLQTVRRVLRSGGAFVFVIGHPAFLAPFATTRATPDGRPARLVDNYLAERFWRSGNPDGVRRVGNHHRPISIYLNGILASNLRLELVDEPTASPLLESQQPVFRAIPVIFGARARRD